MEIANTASSDRKSKSILDVLKTLHKSVGMLFFVFIALILVMGIINPRFFTISNGIILTRQACFLGLISMGQMLVILTGGVDVSLGAIIGLCSVLSAIAAKQYGITAGWLVPIIVGGGVGLFNGAVVAYARIDSFAVTLGSLSICSGLALIISKGLTIYNLPKAFRDLAYSDVFSVPMPIIITAAVIFVMYLLLYRVRFGRYVYAVGGNLEALRLAGVNVNRVILGIFAGAGILTGICAAVLSSRINSGQPNLGGALMMESIAACVVGGVTFQGGVGKLGGVIIGVLFLSALSNGFDLIGVSSFVKQVIVGCIIIFAVVIDKLKK
jgi:ribose/xylose/arabinose/galactoside ABC-type transport system permease subunit